MLQTDLENDILKLLALPDELFEDSSDYNGEFAYTLEEICSALNISSVRSKGAALTNPQQKNSPKQSTNGVLMDMQRINMLKVDVEEGIRRYVHPNNYEEHMTLLGKNIPVIPTLLKELTRDELSNDYAQQLDGSIFGDIKPVQ